MNLLRTGAPHSSLHARLRPAFRGHWVLPRFAMLIALLSLSVLAAPARVESGGRFTREYDRKAAFLFNVTQFVEWPAECLPDSTTPFVIGVVGADPFGVTLDEIVANETVHEHPILVQRWKSLGEVSTCHILFISRAGNLRLHNNLGALRGRGILTVGDSDKFAARGGVIGLVTAGSHLRLEVNLDAARAQRLTISSGLLRQSTIIGAL
jgi:YfiR/HmsC-like